MSKKKMNKELVKKALKKIDAEKEDVSSRKKCHGIDSFAGMINVDDIRREMAKKTNTSIHRAKEGVDSCSLSVFAPVNFLVEFKTAVRILSRLKGDMAGKINQRTVLIDIVQDWIENAAKEINEGGVNYEPRWATAVRK